MSHELVDLEYANPIKVGKLDVSKNLVVGSDFYHAWPAVSLDT